MIQVTQQVCVKLENGTLADSLLILQQHQYEQYDDYAMTEFISFCLLVTSLIPGLRLSILEVATGQRRARPAWQSRFQETSADKTRLAATSLTDVHSDEG